jgi:RNA polymerase sigma-70 factor (ECF subfamily)
VQDYFRSSRNQKRGSGREEEDIELAMLKAEEPHGLYGDMERWILLQQIDECLAGRTAEATCSRDRAIFWLYYRDGLTAKAISELPEIGLSVKGVESTLLRLTRIVRTRLSAATGGGASAPEQHVEEAQEFHSTASCA